MAPMTTPPTHRDVDAEAPAVAAGRDVTAGGSDETLMSLLGGRRAGFEVTLPGVGFVVGWLAGGHTIAWGVVVALATAVGVAVVALHRGRKPRAVFIGLLAVIVAALIALRTGRAADFFLIQVVANLASSLAWLVSILVRRPLLGVVVGTVLGQKTRWRRDPDLVRAYGRASWIWTISYLFRVAVFLPLWAGDHVVALSTLRVALSWPLVAAVLATSWWVVQRTLPDGHPGIRHPRQPASEQVPVAATQAALEPRVGVVEAGDTGEDDPAAPQRAPSEAGVRDPVESAYRRGVSV